MTLVLFVPLAYLIITAGYHNRHLHPYLPIVYRQLPHKKFVRVFDMVFAENPEQDQFTYFLNGKGFLVAPTLYMHGEFFTYLDPYTCYWYIKYRLWFKKNVNIDELPTYQ